MPRFVFRIWLVGVAILAPIVFTVDRFFVREYGPFVGYLIGFAFWVFMAALSYIALRLFVEMLLRD
jgi:hypothetical protein